MGSMFEAAILLVAVFILATGGVVVWGWVRGWAPKLALAARVMTVSLMAASLVACGTWRLANSRTHQLFGEIVPRVETDAPLVALTFDDGPTAAFTDSVLNTLREQDVPATFFVTGHELEKNPTAGRRIVAEGHELANHSYTHARMIFKPLRSIREEIERTDRLIREAGHEGVIHFRSPYGKKLILLPYYLSRTGRKNILFDVEPESYLDIASDSGMIVDHVLEETRPGSIILLHVMYTSRAESRAALPRIIQELQQRGYRFVTVSELLGAGE
jgi:peptidoglycan/xylan/chitin deacetylase (PgdA/CDA1 family)